jgi:hypothetical protein
MFNAFSAKKKLKRNVTSESKLKDKFRKIKMHALADIAERRSQEWIDTVANEAAFKSSKN